MAWNGKVPAGLTLALATALAACTQTPQWVGTYRYEAQYGATAAGTPIVVEFELILGEGDRCQLSVNGFQTAEDIVCDAVVQGDQLTVRFQRHGEETLQPPGSVPAYQVGETLFELHRTDGKLLTQWEALRTPDLQAPPTGELFVAHRP